MTSSQTPHCFAASPPFSIKTHGVDNHRVQKTSQCTASQLPDQVSYPEVRESDNFHLPLERKSLFLDEYTAHTPSVTTPLKQQAFQSLLPFHFSSTKNSNSQPSASVGSASMDSSNHGWKILEENRLPDTHFLIC